MSKNDINDSDDKSCDEEIVDCFLCTKKGHQILKKKDNELTVRQRQLLFLLSKNDTISRSVSEHLLTKISIKNLVEEGLIKQDSPCSTWCPRLQSEEACPQQPKKLAQLSKSKNEISGLLDMIEDARNKEQQQQKVSEVGSEIELIARFTA